MTQPSQVSNDSLQDVLSVAEAVLHDPGAPPRFAIPCLERAWALTLNTEEDLPGAIKAHEALQPAARERFAKAWTRHAEGEPIDRDELLAQLRVLRRMSATPSRRTLYLAVALGVLAVVGLLALRVASGSVAMKHDAPGGRWRVEVFAIKEFRGPSAVFRANDAAFTWKGPPHETMPKDKFATRLSTCLELDAPTKVTFGLIADEGARLFVDGERLINSWSRKNKMRHKAIELSAGSHAIVVEHHDAKGVAEVKLTASIDGGEPAPLPRKMLRYSDAYDKC